MTDVIGTLDGTHIRLSGALNGDTDYINRKGFASVQVKVKIAHFQLIIIITHT
jgi:hypothetical protein